jgi:hypothetical protein
MVENDVPTFVGNLGKVPLGRRRARKESNMKVNIDEV